MRQDLETQAGDAPPARAGHEAVFVLVGMRARSLHREVGFLPEDGAFGGLQRVGPQGRPAGMRVRKFPAGLREPGGERRLGGLPGRLFGRLGGVDERLGFAQGPGRERRLEGQVRLGAAARLAVLVDAVEERGERVVVVDRDRIELVRVALRAAQGESEPGGAHGVHAVEDVVDAGFFRVAAALAVGHVVAVEAGGELLLGGGVREEVAGELLQGEAVVRDVAVEGVHDPVAPRPVVAGGVRLEAVGVGVTRGIQPPHGHAFAVVRRGQEAVDRPLIRVGGLVREEGLGFRFGRRQAGEVEREPTEQGVTRGFGRRFESFGGELPTDEVVDGVTGHGRLLGRFEGPVASPRGAFGDPAAEDVDLRRGQPRFVRVRRRHELVLVRGDDAFDERADLGLAGDERFLGQGGLAHVEPELGLAVRFVLAVAAEAVVREDGEDVPAEAHGLRRAGGQGEREQGAEQRGGRFHLGVILRRSRQF